ncbi:GH3 auxin-responsive promoter [Chiua virens]|nr:GH3 auxin-responsive promoter [Chiua virens]
MHMCPQSKELLSSIPPPLSEQLRSRTNALQSRIVRANYNTQFAHIAPELADFRHATAGFVDGMDDDALSESFRSTVHFTTYEAYAPLVARFSEKPCKETAIVHLFAPGLPDFLVESSATSGGLAKTFPKYNRLSTMRSSAPGSWETADPLWRRTTAYVYYFGCEPVDVENENDRSVATMYLTSASVVNRRIILNLDPEQDEERMGTFILNHAAPYAAGFIKKWWSFLLIHALFAIGSKSLRTISVAFINTFVSMMRHLDSEFDMIVDCIANGTIPDLDGVDEVRHYLESSMLPDPERAAELRRLGRPSSRPGWCSLAWPNLRSITCIASGIFALSVPLARSFLGSNIRIRARGYGSTEAWIGSPYNPLEPNQFKSTDKNVIEFLDVNKSSRISSLAQLWQVESGKQYEVVVTTGDGLWRYRLGDVVEIAGFDATDGMPILQFVERRDVAIRTTDFMVTEKELRAAVSSIAPGVLVNIVDWTTTIDDRHIPATIGFFVEFADEQAPIPDLARAPQDILDALSDSNKNVTWALDHEVLGKPTIRVVRTGTFGAFRQMKLDEGGRGVGQVKVPVVLPKPAYVAWFSDRVVWEV